MLPRLANLFPVVFSDGWGVGGRGFTVPSPDNFEAILLSFQADLN